MLTIAPIGAGGRGADYLINGVGREDEALREIGDAQVAAYFDAATRTGEPAGRWLGSEAQARGLAESEVTREQLRRLFGDGRDPETGELLGRPPRQYRSVAERVEAAEARAV
ncbi:MAG: relaxase domain-containing protein, partial [Acidimicrobiales bacterium]